MAGAEYVDPAHRQFSRNPEGLLSVYVRHVSVCVCGGGGGGAARGGGGGCFLKVCAYTNLGDARGCTGTVIQFAFLVAQAWRAYNAQ